MRESIAYEGRLQKISLSYTGKKDSTETLGNDEDISEHNHKLYNDLNSDQKRLKMDRLIAADIRRNHLIRELRAISKC